MSDGRGTDQQDDKWIGDSDLGERFPAWTRGNAADVFPDPFSPLGQSLVLKQGMSPALRDAYTALGALEYDEYETPDTPDLFKMFGGYVYNPLTLTRILGARMPGASPEMIDQAFFDERDEVPPYEEHPWHISPANEAKLGESVGWAMSATESPELDADREMVRLQRSQRPDLASITDGALLARARSMVPLLQQTFENAMRYSSLSGLGPGALGAVCEGLGDPTLAIRLLAGIEVDSAAPSHAMWDLGRVAAASDVVNAAFDTGPDSVLEELRASDSPDAADFLERFDTFLFEHGSRAQNEYDLYATSWEVKPRIALAAIDLMRRSDESQAPTHRHDASVAERDRIVAEIRERVAGDPETAGTFEAALGSAQLFLAGRERAKTNLVTIINEMRVALREYGRRLVERGVIDRIEKIFMADDNELDRLRHAPETIVPTLDARYEQFLELFDRKPVFVVNGRVPELSEMTPREHSAESGIVGTVLTGSAGSSGLATGRARVVLDAADPEGLEPGDILVAPQTDPSWVPLFVPAAGVVVNVGAMGSHAMIVSRELGVPCVVSVADATDIIPDGATITIDANAGTVTIDALP
ncbi:PEP-utilizing enzyme [Ilumatobacter nonamiensis]|uniref:PEP-utilizing enzyme n=1 Tax=Ilumatobacter nonamiensis TaxID=467093 RepID=UPI000345B808|nr:PEP-utilizing enzyme [Ilumatobacter nonamiensis]